MEWEGRIITCDRCGKECRCKLVDQMETDGGFTHTNRYEEIPKTWKYRYEIGYLCPDCETEYSSALEKFMDEGNKK